MSDCSKVFFESNDVLVVHKAPNILSVRSRFHSTNAEKNVLDTFKTLPVHRLDREVEGLLITAKNKKAQSICNGWFEKKQIKKSYMALTCSVDMNLYGKLPFEFEKISPKIGEDFVWKSKILRGKKRSYASPHGDACETLAKLENVSRLKNETQVYQWTLNPITGRSHQLRFELSKHGHPILGDDLYFAPLLPAYKEGIALIASKIDFSNCPERENLGLPVSLDLGLSWETILGRLSANASLIADKE